MLYTLMCPCGRYDYISYTPMTLAEALTSLFVFFSITNSNDIFSSIDHREHGNRMMYEFLLGSKNIAHMRRHRPKSIE